jgi:restriction system protein
MYQELIPPTFRAIKKLGGSASVDEINERVAADLRLPQQLLEIPIGQRGYGTLFDSRLSWARSYLKMAGLINNSERGVWSLTAEGVSREDVDAREIVQKIGRMSRLKIGTSKAQRRDRNPQITNSDETDIPVTDSGVSETWRGTLLETLLSMPSDSFERLCQRLLRESGFTEVEVTGRSGDGGIDGRGIIRIAGLISFTVLFQSKRHAGTIGAGVVRDFRGAMMGRADKGVVITTGSFTRDARKEATRDGATPIDLIDGNLLAEKLKELRLGVTTKLMEAVEVDAEWFRHV